MTTFTLLEDYTFQSTLSMRRATDVAHFAVQKTDIISIHALHEESDNITFGCVYVAVGFQSTLSMRRATSWVSGRFATQNFNPRSP